MAAPDPRAAEVETMTAKYAEEEPDDVGGASGFAGVGNFLFDQHFGLQRAHGHKSF
ncbi:hypothetical protein Q3H58_001089 [Pseudomonas psychrotolerans]|nr:hypothetical protein [Pseudomonas psychrotolerans]